MAQMLLSKACRRNLARWNELLTMLTPRGSNSVWSPFMYETACSRALLILGLEALKARWHKTKRVWEFYLAQGNTSTQGASLLVWNRVRNQNQPLDSASKRNGRTYGSRSVGRRSEAPSNKILKLAYLREESRSTPKGLAISKSNMKTIRQLSNSR